LKQWPESSSFEMLNAAMQNLWKRNPDNSELLIKQLRMFMREAGIYSEFGKIICISVGFIRVKIRSASGLNPFFWKRRKNHFYRVFCYVIKVLKD